MCLCTPTSTDTKFCPYCPQEVHRREQVAEKVEKDELVTQLKAKLQLLWKWSESLHEVTGVGPPEEYFSWFDNNGKVL